MAFVYAGRPAETRREWYLTLLLDRNYLDIVLRGETLQDAINLGRALGVADRHPDLRASILAVCDLTCQDTLPNPVPIARGHMAPTGPFVNQTSFFIPVGYNRGALCGNPATVMNAGRREFSLCFQDAEIVDANNATLNCHPYAIGGRPPGPEAYTHILVCPPCKQRRALDFRWRRRANWLGVCQDCRNWALANLRPAEVRCTCVPGEGTMNMGFLRGNHQANTQWIANQCSGHDENHWDGIIRPAANAEFRLRREGYRKAGQGSRKKRGNGWTRPKKGADRSPMTPSRKRKAVALPPPPGQANPNFTGTPKCFCGEQLFMADHLRIVGFPAGQVRNCVGCQKFIRVW